MMKRSPLWVAVIAAALVSTASARADGIPPAALDAVKKATVRLRVFLGNGKIAQGSGFFAGEPSVILTNASTLGMLDPSSPPPEKIEVNLDGTRPVEGTVLGIDGVANLAAVRVAGDDLPPPVKFGKAAGVTETQDVYILGYTPVKDREQGKDLTVVKSSVSGLRKLASGVPSQLLISGGTNFGNSGGPILSSAGDVIGVASNTKAVPQPAIPAEAAANFLNGRISGLTVDLAFKDGADVKVPYRVTVVDPLKKLKSAEILFWVGKPGPQRPAAEVEPKPAADDFGFKAFKVPLDGSAQVSGELTLPPRPDNQSYWFRTTYTDGDGKNHWRAAIGVRPIPVDRTPVTLTYKPKAVGYVQLTNDAELKLREPSGETHSLKMNVHPKFREQRAGMEAPVRFVHNYTGLDFSINMDNEPMNKAGIQAMIQQLRNVTADVEMAADGGVEKAKANVNKVPPGPREDMQIITDQILQSVDLMALPLPSGEIKPLQTWKAQRVIDIGPSWASVSSAVDVKFTYLGVSQQGGKTLAVFEMKGPLKTKRGEGINVRGNLDGTVRVDTETGEVVTSRLSVKADMDIKLEKATWTGHGEVAMTLTRSDTPPAPAVPKK
ncbi:S1 family peptidase [Limnoglobus roseus]|uniref:Serine protease n=1 Tax=Limnoglobus roseus TaxID=2598579 RepID=A0A5C1ABV8_9BACT|nr:serine protease [Limnoglobus roseus]QEL15663.1 serine protease [Limnoglobus roseus]